MQASIAAFHRSNILLNGKAIQVTLDPRGSIDAQQRILNGTLLPAAWSPASALELNQLSTAWRQAHSGQDIIVSSGDLLPTSLVFSPLVFAVWKERAQVLLRKYGKSTGRAFMTPWCSRTAGRILAARRTGVRSNLGRHAPINPTVAC